MTCIVGYIEKDRVVIAGDSCGTSYDNDYRIRKDTKVFKLGDFIIGASGSFRMIQLLQYSLNPPEIKDKDLLKYMCTDFINAVRECFREGGYLQNYEAGDEKGEDFMVAYKNRLFTIYEDFQVEESANNISALGAGAKYAIGALDTLRPFDYPADYKCELALITTSKYNSSVKEPFIFLST